MKKLKIVLAILALFVLGFFREFLFENINRHLMFLWQQKDNPYLPDSLSFLKGFDYYPLYYSKFFLIVVFTALFLSGSMYLVHLFFDEKRYVKFTAFFFVGVFLLSALIFGFGWLTGTAHEAYGISRKLIEFIQSPLACFFLIPAFALYKKSNT